MRTGKGKSLMRVLLAAATGACLLCGVPAARAAAVVETVSTCFVEPPEDAASVSAPECGYVTVPEDRSAPGGRTVKLAFLRLKARTPGKAAPLFMLAGGPGSSLIRPEAFMLFSPPFLGPILETRDVVILDQRGAGHTVPRLDCPEYYALPWTVLSRSLGTEAGIALADETLGRCVQEARRQGVDLAQYNSVAIAADVNAAREALGYDRIVYYGASYGAQLGQHVMRDFPGILEAVVLDGANALSRRSWIEDRALDADWSLRHLAELCESDQKCRASYDIPALVERGLALFDEGPIPASYTDPKDPGTTLRFEVRQPDFVALVYGMLGYKIGVASLPATLEQLVKGGRGTMAAVLGPIIGAKVLASRGATSGEMVMLMHLAVVCSDDPVRSVDELVLDGVRSRFGRLFGLETARDYVRYCALAGVPSLPDATDVDVTAAIPTLILSGGLDAQTPTFRSEVVARALPEARLVVFRDGTHVQVGAINLCAGRIMAQFVRDPKGPLPLACVEELRFPGFVLPDGNMSR